MEKIMFNERFGLQQATFDGTKTMTRRIVPDVILNYVPIYQQQYYEQTLSTISVEDAIMNMVGPERMFQRYVYQVGEIVAIAQKYKDMALHVYNKRLVRLDKEDGTEPEPLDRLDTLLYLQSLKGFNNKMFVKAEWMPHHIKIKSRRLEHLQDISDEDCLREGITHVETGINHYGVRDTVIGTTYYFYTPREAFAFLIDRIGKRGTWDSNPYVFAYECERID